MIFRPQIYFNTYIKENNVEAGGLSSRNEMTYTNRVKNNFFTMTMPRYILGNEAANSTEQEAQDLADRRRHRDDLLKSRAETSDAYQKALKDLADFKKQATAYREANNVKNPTAEEREIIATVTRSVSDVQLTGPGHGVPEIDRQIAAYALILKKRKDEAMKAWNEAGKVKLESST